MATSPAREQDKAVSEHSIPLGNNPFISMLLLICVLTVTVKKLSEYFLSDCSVFSLVVKDIKSSRVLDWTVLLLLYH